jgi:hypothetical protein
MCLSRAVSYHPLYYPSTIESIAVIIQTCHSYCRRGCDPRKREVFWIGNRVSRVKPKFSIIPWLVLPENLFCYPDCDDANATRFACPSRFNVSAQSSLFVGCWWGRDSNLTLIINPAIRPSLAKVLQRHTLKVANDLLFRGTT